MVSEINSIEAGQLYLVATILRTDKGGSDFLNDFVEDELEEVTDDLASDLPEDVRDELLETEELKKINA